MKITKADRSLAAEIADLFGCTDQRTVGALAVVFWSHRQLGADSTSEAPPPEKCRSEYQPGPNLHIVRCQLPMEHHNDHTDGNFYWFGAPR